MPRRRKREGIISSLLVRDLFKSTSKEEEEEEKEGREEGSKKDALKPNGGGEIGIEVVQAEKRDLQKARGRNSKGISSSLGLIVKSGRGRKRREEEEDRLGVEWVNIALGPGSGWIETRSRTVRPLALCISRVCLLASFHPLSLGINLFLKLKRNFGNTELRNVRIHITVRVGVSGASTRAVMMGPNERPFLSRKQKDKFYYRLFFKAKIVILAVTRVERPLLNIFILSSLVALHRGIPYQEDNHP